jgi:hypothetical protein
MLAVQEDTTDGRGTWPTPMEELPVTVDETREWAPEVATDEADRLGLLQGGIFVSRDRLDLYIAAEKIARGAAIALWAGVLGVPSQDKPNRYAARARVNGRLQDFIRPSMQEALLALVDEVDAANNTNKEK